MLGIRIKNARENKNLTQEQLADLAGVTRTTINLVENEKMSVSTKLIDKLGVILETDFTQDLVLDDNYYKQDSDSYYMSATQFKNFIKCEAAELARLKGEYKPELTPALLEGLYLDSRVEGAESFNNFKLSHPEIYLKSGALKADFEKAESAFQRVMDDDMFTDYLEGEKQVIMKGAISGVPFKIKMDVYNLEKKRIVDLKYMRDFKLIWDDKDRKYKHFIESWGYDIQLAIYQEIVRQNTGVKCECYIAGVTKEKEVDYNLFNILQRDLDEALEFVKQEAPRIQKIKNGELEPSKCCECAYCKQTKRLKEVVTFTKHFEELV